MTCKKFESTISYHCSPVLMGIKPANLVSFSKEKMPELPKYVAYYAKKFSEEGICMEILCGCRKHYLLMVYRPQMLEAYLNQDDVREILLQDGYPINAKLSEMLDLLKKRFEAREGFPHEIGLFLGYPLEDVTGFRIHNGSSPKLCGYWKVYGDVEHARKQFALFDQCRDFIEEQLRQGYSILQAVGRKHLCALQEAY